MNRITKTLAAIIAVLMLAAAFTACAKPQGDTETSGDGDTSTATPETTSEFVNDDLSDDLKINDTVTFLYWKDVERPEFFVEESEDDGNIVNTRISERNKIVESRLGVTLEWDGVAGNYGNQKGFKDIFIEQHPDMTVSDMYKLVTDGRWTIDKMIELCDGVYRDENANGVVDYEDLYGFETIDLHFDAFYIGSDLKLLDKDETGALVMSPDFTSEKTHALLEKITNFFYDSGFAFTKGTTSKYSSAQSFKSARVLYTVDRVYIASGTLKDVDFKYGILPVPKYDEEQSEYRTCMAFPFTLYSVSVKAKDADAAAAVLECLGSESYRRITPALFEQSMKVRYSESPDDSAMYDLVKKSVAMDLARIFTTPLNNNSYAPFRNAVKNDTAAGWSRSTTQLKNVINVYIKNINSAMSGQ